MRRERADLRKAALDALSAYSVENGFKREVGPALEALRLDQPWPEDVSEADLQLKFYFYWHLDLVLAHGKTIVETFLETAGQVLPPRQQSLLRRLAAARLRPYEVEEVRADEGLTLLDLRSGESLCVRERSATHQLERWDVLVARVAAEEDGVLEMEGAPYFFPPAMKSTLLSNLRKEEGKMRRRSKPYDEDALFRHFAPIVHGLWLDRVVARPRPTIVTAEGDPMLLGKVVFDVLDEGALLDALDRHSDLVAHPDGGYTWVEESGEGFTRTLGGISISGDRLTLEVTSRQHAERGRALLETAAGSSVRHRATRYESVESAMAHARRRPRPPEAPVPSAEAARVLGDFKDRHYRTWPDVPLPALDGRTPRHAARLKTLRPRLIDLLKDMENHERRASSPESSAYDFGWIWRELGLG